MRAAIGSAHGNSGAIVAQMVTSAARSLAASAPGPAVPPGVLVADIADRAARAAIAAVACPVRGTILTVAEAAAQAAATSARMQPYDALAVAQAAQRGAYQALRETPQQLPVLAQAGVVDAGGQGLVLLVDVVVEVLGGPPAAPLLSVVPPRGDQAAPGSRIAPDRPPEYEVMYALQGATADALDAVRSELALLGSSVIAVGDTALAQVHVHTAQPGPAVERGLQAGVLSSLRITALPAMARPHRQVLALVAGPGLAGAVETLGGTAILAGPGSAVPELMAATSSGCDDLVILPNDMEALEAAISLSGQLRSAGRRVAVIPSVSQVQGLAAMAVHEPSADFDAAVAAMSSAAGHARHAAVTVAESPTMTLAGRCAAGDVLGVFDGDFVEIGDDVVEVGWHLVLRLLGGSGELLTLVAGAGLSTGVLPELERRARHFQPGLEVERLDGGQPRYLVLAGLE